MKTVLCYGDSNTWGADPTNPQRFAPEIRWTGVLASILGNDYRVIEEGLNGRTTNCDDPIEPNRNGRTYLPPCLESHQPLDLVIIMLGTNDLKHRFNRTASDIAQSAASLGTMARRIGRTADDRSPLVLLMAPPPIATLTELDQMFAGATETSRQFVHYYRLAARWHNLDFFDTGQVIVSSKIDGIHLEADQHQKLGHAVAAEVQRLLGT